MSVGLVKNIYLLIYYFLRMSCHQFKRLKSAFPRYNRLTTVILLVIYIFSPVMPKITFSYKIFSNFMYDYYF